MQPVQGNLPAVGGMARRRQRPVKDLIKDIDDPRGWPVLQASLEALARGDIFGHNNLDNLVLQFVNSRLTLVYEMSIQRPPNNHSVELYLRYTAFFAAHLDGTFLPALRAQETSEQLCAELAEQWQRYAHLAKWAGPMFMHVDMFLHCRGCMGCRGCSAPKLKDVPALALRDTVLPCIASELRPGVDGAAAQQLAQLFLASSSGSRPKASRNGRRDGLNEIVDVGTDLAVLAATHDARILCHIPDAAYAILQTDRGLMMQNLMCMPHAHEDLRKDRQLVLTVVR